MASPTRYGGAVLPALVVGQVGLHTAMAGVRLAMPLQALQEGYSAWAVGVLLALFAVLPVATALPAGRMTDRHGYHRPLRWAVCAQLAACALAVVACWVAGPAHFVMLCVAAAVSGASANMGMITIQRSAGRLADDATERLRVFSWLGVAPSAANVIGPVAVGLTIDGAGFAAAYGLMMSCPLVTLWAARRVPRETGRAMSAAVPVPGQSTRDLLRLPAMKRLMSINWLLSASWDVQAFAVPVMGHQLAFSASTIGFILGAFTMSVTLVRVVVPLLAHRLRQDLVLRASMVWTGAVLALYPWAVSPWAMGGLAVLLGLSLGVVQPIIMTTLHRLTPENRHGEAIALRSMVINASSSLMPLTFGVVGTALGPAVLFWAMAALVAGGSPLSRRLGGAPRPAQPAAR
ncbi:MAG: MFS transporter [Aquabacterium sp.]